MDTRKLTTALGKRKLTEKNKAEEPICQLSDKKAPTSKKRTHADAKIDELSTYLSFGSDDHKEPVRPAKIEISSSGKFDSAGYSTNSYIAASFHSTVLAKKIKPSDNNNDEPKKQIGLKNI